MTAAGPIEELLREALARLGRQEQRTDALEAAVRGFSSASGCDTVQMPAQRADTPVSPWPAPRRTPRPVPPPVPAPIGTTAAAVVDSLDDVVWSVSPDGRVVLFAGGAVERLYGTTAQELRDGPGRWLDAVLHEDRERFRAALARLTDTGSFQLEHRVRRANRGVRWAVTRGKLVRDPDGRPLRVDGSTTDVTRSARPRAAVLAVLDGVGHAAGADFLQQLVRHLCTACDGRAAVLVEPAGPDEVRVRAGWADGAAVGPVVLPVGAGPVPDLLAGTAVLVPASARERFPHAPLLTRFRAEALAAEPLVDACGRRLGFVAVVSDRAFPAEHEVPAVLKALAPRAAVEFIRATEPPRASTTDTAQDERLTAAEARAAAAEEALRGCANLAAAGRLAAGVAHDFHNLLGVIVGNADLLREGLDADDPKREFAETIAATAHTVAAVSRQLVAMGKPTAARPSAPLDVGNAIRALEPILRRLTGRGLPLAFELAAGLPLVRADATDFDRVLLNLVLNARDASRPGDTITVRGTLTAVEPGRPEWPADLPRGEYVTVTVADQGCGMSAEVRARMFDPFFTTKGDRGTGLGLATVRDAVRAARGHIEVESAPGWGTTIRLYWPPL